MTWNICEKKKGTTSEWVNGGYKAFFFFSEKLKLHSFSKKRVDGTWHIQWEQKSCFLFLTLQELWCLYPKAFATKMFKAY